MPETEKKILYVSMMKRKNAPLTTNSNREIHVMFVYEFSLHILHNCRMHNWKRKNVKVEINIEIEVKTRLKHTYKYTRDVEECEMELS